MPDPVQVLAITGSVILFLLVLELVRQRLLGEEYAFVWIAGAIGLLAMAIWRDALDTVARWLGIHYGPALLLLLLTVFVFVALLFFSAVVSRHRVQIERLIEDVAILEARLRDRGTEPLEDERQLTEAPDKAVKASQPEPTAGQ